jgi:ATP-dependent Clp protease ATP-binding subunit ClpC
MFDRFTDRARKTMGLARLEAQRLTHDYIGTEHMLLGLILEGSGVAADVLKNLDIDTKRVRAEVLKLVTPGDSMVTMGQLPFTPRGKRVLELALEEASTIGHNYIGTEHLLLGLIREEHGVAARVLRSVGLSAESVREEILELLGVEGTPERIPRSELSELAALRARVDALEARMRKLEGDPSGGSPRHPK